MKIYLACTNCIQIEDLMEGADILAAAKLLYNNNLGEYFNVLKMCRDMAAEEEENKGAFLK